MTGGFRSETKDFTMKTLIFLAIVTRSPAIEFAFNHVFACRDGGKLLCKPYCIDASDQS
jgi:hypothetical protein